MINEKERHPNSRKRILVRIAVVVAAVLAVLVAAYLILARAADRTPEVDYEFFEPDRTVDIMQDPDYLEKGWSITYTSDAGETTVIEDDDYLKYGIGVELLSYYFSAIQDGDAETYNSLFGDEYIAVNGKHAGFTPQRVYDITIRLLYSESPNDGADLYTYEIGYKIMINDGTFTREIGSDMSRRQYFVVCSDASGVYIKSTASVYRGN